MSGAIALPIEHAGWISFLKREMRGASEGEQGYASEGQTAAQSAETFEVLAQA